MARQKAIRGNEDYLIFEDGRVYSTLSNRFLSVFDRGEYFAVTLGRSRKEQKIYFLHRLLAEAFLPNPKNKTQVNHIDGDKYNNHLSNLEWCTPSENNIHAYSTGLNLPKEGADSHASKLNKEQVLEIRWLLANTDMSQQNIADFFGISRGAVQGIKEGVTWKNL